MKHGLFIIAIALGLTACQIRDFDAVEVKKLNIGYKVGTQYTSRMEYNSVEKHFRAVENNITEQIAIFPTSETRQITTTVNAGLTRTELVFGNDTLTNIVSPEGTPTDNNEITYNSEAYYVEAKQVHDETVTVIDTDLIPNNADDSVVTSRTTRPDNLAFLRYFASPQYERANLLIVQKLSGDDIVSPIGTLAEPLVAVPNANPNPVNLLSQQLAAAGGVAFGREDAKEGDVFPLGHTLHWVEGKEDLTINIDGASKTVQATKVRVMEIQDNEDLGSNYVNKCIQTTFSQVVTDDTDDQTELSFDCPSKLVEGVVYYYNNFPVKATWQEVDFALDKQDVKLDDDDIAGDNVATDSGFGYEIIENCDSDNDAGTADVPCRFISTNDVDVVGIGADSIDFEKNRDSLQRYVHFTRTDKTTDYEVTAIDTDAEITIE